jgi:hypothetical protein
MDEWELLSVLDSFEYDESDEDLSDEECGD